MLTNKCLPWLRHAIGCRIILSFLFGLFVITTKSHFHPIDFYSDLNDNNELVAFTNFVTTACTGPNITTPPNNQSACNNTTASFSVIASGVGTLSYQWQENQGSGFNNIPGANNASYIINSVAASQNNYTYQVIITDDNATPGDASDDCMKTSTIVTLTVFSLTCETSPWGGNN